MRDAYGFVIARYFSFSSVGRKSGIDTICPAMSFRSARLSSRSCATQATHSGACLHPLWTASIAFPPHDALLTCPGPCPAPRVTRRPSRAVISAERVLTRRRRTAVSSRSLVRSDPTPCGCRSLPVYAHPYAVARPWVRACGVGGWKKRSDADLSQDGYVLLPARSHPLLFCVLLRLPHTTLSWSNCYV